MSKPSYTNLSALFLVDDHGLIASWNEIAADLTGYGAERVLGKSFAMLCEPEAARAFHLQLAKAIATGHAACACALWHGDGRSVSGHIQLARVGGRGELHGECICCVRVDMATSGEPADRATPALAVAAPTGRHETRRDSARSSSPALGVVAQCADDAMAQIHALREGIAAMEVNLALLAKPTS